MTISTQHIEKNFVEINYQSDDCFNDLIDSFKGLLELDRLPDHLLILSNANECNLQMTYEDTELFVQLLLILSERCVTIKHAIITDFPKHTAMMSVAIEKLKGIKNYYPKLFCTESAARHFLQVT